MGTTKVEGAYWRHECNRCNEVWYSRKESPKCCNECNSPYWNKERVRIPSKHERATPV